MIKIIAAVDRQGAIGKNNSIPWSYSEDMKWFRSQTKDSVVIMGKNTLISMGLKSLPKRRNIVVSSELTKNWMGNVFNSEKRNIETYPSIKTSLNVMLDYPRGESPDVWFIGGSNIYREGMRWAEEIYLTLIPEYIEGADRFFPWIDPTKFQVKEYLPLFDETGKQTLQVAKYVRIQ